MFNLSQSDRDFYAKEDSWFYGPIFELKLVFDEELSGEKLSEFLIEKLELLVWEDKSETNYFLKTIACLKDGSTVGLEHGYYFSKREVPFFRYKLGIRPSQLIRLIKYYPDISEGMNPFKWDDLNFEKMDITAFLRIIGFFKYAILEVASQFPLKYATISDEGKGWIFPGPNKNVKEGLYIDKDLEFLLPLNEFEVSPSWAQYFLYQSFEKLSETAMNEVILPEELQEAWKYSSRHRDAIEQSGLCGCYLCFSQFMPSRITEWIEDGQTALCPYCFLDGVLPSNKNAKWITDKFLRAMRYKPRFRSYSTSKRSDCSE